MSNPWGPPPPRPGAGVQRKGHTDMVNDQGIGAAVAELHRQHPHHVQGEGLQNKSTTAIHHPVTSRTYGGKE
jgi:hypothetical protein